MGGYFLICCLICVVGMISALACGCGAFACYFVSCLVLFGFAVVAVGVDLYCCYFACFGYGVSCVCLDYLLFIAGLGFVVGLFAVWWIVWLIVLILNFLLLLCACVWVTC